VSSLLQVALGGSAVDFNVTQISARVFRFSVSCRKVGFLINHLQYYKCESFIVYFNLWNNGGANRRKELDVFEKEEHASRQTVSHKKGQLCRCSEEATIVRGKFKASSEGQTMEASYLGL
jgi:hypothetical protein